MDNITWPNISYMLTHNILLLDFIESLEIPEEAKEKLRALSPSNYIGSAANQAKKI